MFRKRYNSRAIWGKLNVCRYLKSDKRTRAFVPQTARLTEASLKRMAAAHRSLYIKPDIGSLGIGIHKMTRTGDGYVLRSTRRRSVRKRSFANLTKLYRHLQSKRQKRIVQRAIPLDTVEARPYDIRAMVQRRPGGPWTCTGLFVKVGAADRIVTNYYQGGQIWTIRKLLKRKRLPESAIKSKIRDLSRLSEKVSRILAAKRSGMYEMGIDWAFDKNGKLWILEVNSNHPQFHPLRKLDRTAYNRMRSFARSYGRYDA